MKRVFFDKPQIVFHLAAFFANQNSLDHPERDLQVNGMGTLRLLEYSVFTGVERFVYASSGCSIYGSHAPLPLTEEFMSLHLTTPYQITKMLGELYCNFFWHHYELKVVKARFFNSYGPGEIPGQYRNVIPNFIYWAMKGKPLPITGNGEATRDFTYVGDIVDGLMRSGVMPEAVGEEFNLPQAPRLASSIWRNRSTALSAIAPAFKPPKSASGIPRTGCSLRSIRRATSSLQSKYDLRSRTRRDHSLVAENWDRIEAAARFGPGVSSAVREMANSDAVRTAEVIA